MRKSLGILLTGSVLVVSVISTSVTAERYPECDIPHISANWGDMHTVELCLSELYLDTTGRGYSISRTRGEQFSRIRAGVVPAGILSVGRYLSLVRNGQSNMIPIAAMPMNHGEIGFHAQLLSEKISTMSDINKIAIDKIQLQSSASITGLSAPFLAIADYLPQDTTPSDLMQNATDFNQVNAEGLMDNAEVLSWWSIDPDTAMKGFSIDATDMNVLWSSPMVPHTAVVVDSAIGKENIDAFRESLLSMSPQTLKCINNAISWEIEGFQEVDTEDFHYVKDMFDNGLANEWVMDHHK